jgi:hypothetical protein
MKIDIYLLIMNQVHMDDFLLLIELKEVLIFNAIEKFNLIYISIVISFKYIIV